MKKLLTNAHETVLMFIDSKIINYEPTVATRTGKFFTKAQDNCITLNQHELKNGQEKVNYFILNIKLTIHVYTIRNICKTFR